MRKKLLTRFFIIIILVSFFFFVLMMFSYQQPKTPPSYYAVFLTNGQVYFGQIKKIDNQTISLSDVYYLRANANLQNVQDGESNEAKKEANVEVALIKFGNELHGPKDSMIINKTNTLFWEELREDGRVVQAIKRHDK